MVRSKPGPNKPKRGVDFKKIKHKIGRKLPPKRNFTDTQIKSKAIVLPEQSVASDRAGLAVNKKGLTLRELLQQTSHHNAKIRKAALVGIKDLLLKHPSELKLHKLAVIERLRERICDNEKFVRETLYQLLESDIFPSLKEDISSSIVSLLMAYIFNAMTHMVADVRMMGFKFFNLVIQNFPSSFIMYGDKVLDNYIDILRNNHIYLQDANKLKNVLDGLVGCMSSLVSSSGEHHPSNEPNIIEKRRLHSFENMARKDRKGLVTVVKKLDDLLPVLVNSFREYATLIRTAPIFDVQSFDCMLKTIHCIHLAVRVLVNESHLPSTSYGLLPASLSYAFHGGNTTLSHLIKLWEPFPIGKMHPTEKEDERYFILNIRIIEIYFLLSDWIDHGSIPIDNFLRFIGSSFGCLLPAELGSNLPSNKTLVGKHFGPVVLFIPRLVLQITVEWRTYQLEAFTDAYKQCKVDSKLCLPFLSAIEEMLVPVKGDHLMSVISGHSNVFGYQVAWIQHLPNILLQSGDKYPSVSKVVLRLMVRIGQSCQQNSVIAKEYDSLQLSLKGLYIDSGACHGSFLKLPKDCQELAICALFYTPTLGSDFLRSLTTCCLCDDMEPVMLLRIIEVLHSSYRAGRVHIADFIGILVTLVARKVFSDKVCIIDSDGKVSQRATYKALNVAVCSCLPQMGDNSLVLKLLCKSIFNEMESRNLSMNNMHGLLRMMASLNRSAIKLMEENIDNLSSWLYVYLIEVASNIPRESGSCLQSYQICIFRYYMQPCVILFSGSGKLLFDVLKLFDSSIKEASLSGPEHALKPFDRVQVICSILNFMLSDGRLHRILLLCETPVKSILQSLQSLLQSNDHNLTLEVKHSIEISFQQLQSNANKLQLSKAGDLARV